MPGFIIFIFLVMGVVFLIKTKVTNKGTALIEKALTSVLSAFIFSALIVHSVGMPIEVAFIFSFPMFLIIGGFISFFADVYLNTIDFNHIFIKYITGLFIYIISGFFIISLFFAFFGGGMNFLIVAIPALLFYHISLLFKAILKKEVTLIKDQ